jgi:hypothetical protein
MLKEINESHRRFWENQHLLLTQRMTDVAVRETAFEAMRAEQVRGLPLYYQSSIYQALEDAEHTGFVERRPRDSIPGPVPTGNQIRTY